VEDDGNRTSLVVVVLGSMDSCVVNAVGAIVDEKVECMGIDEVRSDSADVHSSLEEMEAGDTSFLQIARYAVRSLS
jgi:hypothetical protein